MPRFLRPLAVLLLSAAPLASFAQAPMQSVTGQAAVRPNAPFGVKLTPSGQSTPNRTGLSVAQTQVSPPLTETYAISAPLMMSRPATVPEMAKMQSVMGLAKALIPLAAPPATMEQRAAANAAFAAGAGSLLAPVPTIPLVAVDFPRIGKAAQVLTTGTITDSVGNLGNMNGGATASAVAIQNSVKNPRVVDTTGTTANALISVGAVIKAPQAAAYAVNLDPSQVDWSSQSSHTVVLDLTGLQLQALTTAPGAAAVATEVFTGAFRDGTDITQPESGATGLFTLSFGAYSHGGMPAADAIGLSFLGETVGTDPGGLLISDSAGGNGLTQVFNDLVANFVPGADGTFNLVNTLFPATDYTITMTVPGTSPSSVLYFDDYQAAVTVAPEPSAAAVLAGIVPLFLGLRRVGRRLGSRARITGQRRSC